VRITDRYEVPIENIFAGTSFTAVISQETKDKPFYCTYFRWESSFLATYSKKYGFTLFLWDLLSKLRLPVYILFAGTFLLAVINR
jgi:hypothetical protein